MISRSNDPGLDVSSIYNLQVTKTNDVHWKKNVQWSINECKKVFLTALTTSISKF